jgi:predicted amidohydrolase YtcJ
LNAAYASFDGDKRGNIEVGKFADLTILSDDPLKVPPYGIKDVIVDIIIVDGKVVYVGE